MTWQKVSSTNLSSAERILRTILRCDSARSSEGEALRVVPSPKAVQFRMRTGQKGLVSGLPRVVLLDSNAGSLPILRRWAEEVDMLGVRRPCSQSKDLQPRMIICHPHLPSEITAAERPLRTLCDAATPQML